MKSRNVSGRPITIKSRLGSRTIIGKKINISPGWTYTTSVTKMVYSCCIQTNYYPSTGSGWPNLISKFSSLGNRWSAISSFRSLEHSFYLAMNVICAPTPSGLVSEISRRRKRYDTWFAVCFLNEAFQFYFFLFNYCPESIEKESHVIYFKIELILFFYVRETFNSFILNFFMLLFLNYPQHTRVSVCHFFFLLLYNQNCY